jgi:mRNA interferase MazF
MNHGDVYWANLPDRGGHEQRGRRPVVIWQDTANFPLPTVLIIPFTANQAALRYAATLLIQPTATNGLTSSSVALVFQLGACDVSRLGDRLGHLDDADLAHLQDLARRLQMLP